MSEVRPAALAHRGAVVARGVWLGGELLGEGRALRRALALWEPGAELFRCAGGIAVRWAEPRLLDTRAAPGTPLVEQGEALLAAPLTGRERDSLAPARGSVVLVRGGAALVVLRESGDAIDPASALDPGEYQLAALAPLSAAPRIALAAPPQADLRALAHAAGEPAATAALRQVLRGAAQGSRLDDAPGLAGRLRALAARLFGRALQQTAGALKPASKVNERSFTNKEALSLLDRLAARLAALGQRLMLASGLAELAGRRHGRYLGELLDLFAQGDLDQALRRAIPLDGEGERGPAAPPGLRLPAPRGALTPALRRPGASRGLALQSELFDHLRSLYRTALQKLIAEARHEEAAFVLADLLGQVEEAVALLERAGKLRLAAALAESRGLAPGLVVRLWFAAGDQERAGQHARRTGAFLEAVTLAERGNDAGAAVALRTLWALTLAAQGDYASATDVVWRAPELRALARDWIEAALELGGTAAARLLPRKLALDPGSLPDVQARVLAFCDDEDQGAMPARLALANALRELPDHAAARALLRPTVRALVRDRGNHPGALSARALAKLAADARDPALVADLPHVRPPPAWPLLERTAPLVHVIAAADAGLASPGDAALLPDGRLLIALGEAGVLLLSRAGKLQHRFGSPAHRLVLSDHGDRALALARRGQLLRAARLDLRTRTATDWVELPLTAWAASHDGSLWFAAEGDTLLALDLLDPAARALWRVPGMGASVASIARRGDRLTLLTTAGERWIYELPALALRSRTEALTAAGRLAPGVTATSSDGSAAAIRLLSSEDLVDRHSLELRGAAGAREDGPATDGWPAGTPALAAGWAASASRGPEGASVALYSTPGLRLRARVELRGASRVALRFGPGHLVACDDRGRVLAIELDEGTLLRNLRV